MDNKKIYEEKILPVIEELKKVCSECGMPVFVTVCTNNTDTATEYIADMISPLMLKQELTDDHFTKHLAVLNGFEVTASKPDIVELEFPVE